MFLHALSIIKIPRLCVYLKILSLWRYIYQGRRIKHILSINFLDWFITFKNHFNDIWLPSVLMSQVLQVLVAILSVYWYNRVFFLLWFVGKWIITVIILFSPAYMPNINWSWCTVLCLVTQSCPSLCDPWTTTIYYILLLYIVDPWTTSPGSSVHGDSPGKNTGVGCHALLQGIFPTQGSNPSLPHCRQILHHLSHQWSPRTLEWLA